MNTIFHRTDGQNQRLSTKKQRKQQHLLDVKVRSRKALQHRNRRIVSWLCKLILLTSLIGGIYYGVNHGLNRFLWQNPDYLITDIEIIKDGTLSRGQVLNTAAFNEGQNIFSINLSRARKDLANLPQVEHVVIQRVLPNKIVITLAERKPVAWLAANSVEDPSTSDLSFLVDAKGALIKGNMQQPEYLHLPVIYGIEIEKRTAGQIIDTPELKSALDLIRLNSDGTRFQIQSIDLSKGYCMMITDRNRTQITFALDKIDWQLKRLTMLLDEVDLRKKELQTVNLMVQRNVPVTFMPLAEEQITQETVEKSETQKEKPAMPVKKAEPVIKKTKDIVKRATPVIRKD